LLAVLYGIVWTLLPFWLEPNFRYDVIEMFFIGKEGVIATFKHPALNAILLEIVYQALGRNSIAPFLLAQLFFLATAWSLWRLGREFLSPQNALFGALTFYCYWGFFYKSLYYNHNIILMPAWGFVTLFAFQALKYNRYRDWLRLGTAIGLGVYCKYTLLLLIVAILLFMFLNKPLRKYWLRPGPYLTLFVSLIIAAPLIDWMFQSDFSGLKFPSTAYGLEKTLPNRFIAVCNDALISPPLLAISFIVLLFPLFGFPARFQNLDNQQRFVRNFLLGMIGFPWLFSAVSCFVTATPLEFGSFIQLPIFVGLLLLVVFQTQQTRRAICWVWLIFGLSMAGYLFGYTVHSYYSHYMNSRQIFYMYPGRQLAEEAEKIWHEKYDKPLPYVTGGWWFAGNVAIYGADRPTYHGADHPSQLSNCHFPISNWSTDQDVLKQGGLVLWAAGQGKQTLPELVRKRFPSAQLLQNAIHLRPNNLHQTQPLYIGVAIIPPNDSLQTEPFRPAPYRFY
ncbi:MAG: glycosyltransferase family 39 protein, partial [Planctomycetaceae bacterium]|nr:glycosyltransferase family 39 protein [Planctomycetaceae bacterium]